MHTRPPLHRSLVLLVLTLAGCDGASLALGMDGELRDAAGEATGDAAVEATGDAAVEASAPGGRLRAAPSTPVDLATAVAAPTPSGAIGREPASASHATPAAPSSSLDAPVPAPAPLASEHEARDAVDVGPEPPAGFHFAFTDGATFVVLRAHTAEDWGVGPLTLRSREAPTIVTRDVDSRRLPADVPRPGARFVLRDGQDAVCEAELGAPRLLRRVDPDWTVSARWSGEGGPRPADDLVAAEAWELVPEAELLVAEARVVEGDCRRAHWAHPADAALDLGARAAISMQRVLTAFRALDAYRDLQEGWEHVRADDPDSRVARWDARPGARTVLRFASQTGRRFALVEAHAHDGCGDFAGGLHALFEVPARGAPRLVTSGSLFDDSPRVLVDVDLDGVPEVVFRSRIVHGDGSVDVSTPYLGCPC